MNSYTRAGKVIPGVHFIYKATLRLCKYQQSEKAAAFTMTHNRCTPTHHTRAYLPYLTGKLLDWSKRQVGGLYAGGPGIHLAPEDGAVPSIQLLRYHNLLCKQGEAANILRAAENNR